MIDDSNRPQSERSGFRRFVFLMIYMLLLFILTSAGLRSIKQAAQRIEQKCTQR